MKPTMTSEGIAIIGLGCRVPGADSPEAFWQLLRNGVDAISEIPSDRWNLDELYDPQPGKPGKISTRWGGFLDQVDGFDADFFGISPREAERMDPQQRLVLEVTWEALEHAGIVPESLAESQTGVFLGAGNYDYCRMLARDVNQASAYDGTGNALAINANRVSYSLNLRGPSLAIDTACSSSLVALHYACESLRHGESNLCLTGGVSLMLSPEPFITYSHAHMMAADGRCKTFDASADGYVRGEGCGVVVLKRLADAQRDGDRILAVIRGTAVNQDGLSNGLTAPNGPSQQSVIRQALKNAGVAPGEISYVEAHGTGTSLGDPIEYKSLKAVLMGDRAADRPCWLGTAKTNIGHLEAAAGVTGLIKVVLAMQHQEIPRHLHLQQVNPYISLEGTTFRIPTEHEAWEPGQERRLAGVSAFGFGGTNCHVIVEEAIAEAAIPEESSTPQILMLSAKNEAALQTLAQRYVEYLEQPKADLSSICFTTNQKRSQFNHRLAVVGSSAAELREALTQAIGTDKGSSKRPKVAFLFTGQGSQYADMGHELYETNGVFREAIGQCDEFLSHYLDHSLVDILYGDARHLINQTAYAQPTIFALEYALFQVWKSWGIQPAVVMGHSVGEYVAACVADVFTLADACKLIVARARLMQALPQDGKMVAAFTSSTVVKSAIHGMTNIAIAAVNGASNVVVSGESEAIHQIVSQFKSQGIKTRALNVSHAFHSPLMEPILSAFAKVCREVTYSPPCVKLISNLTGKMAAEEVATADYWGQHLRQAVQFAAGMETLQQAGYRVFLEVGAKPTLLGMGRYCLEDADAIWLPTLYPGQPEQQTMLQSLAQLYMQGAVVDGAIVSPGKHRVSLPTYPWQRQRYWANVAAHPSPTLPLLKLLDEGNIQEVMAQLNDELSDHELTLLPRLLEALTQQPEAEGSFADWLYEMRWVEASRGLNQGVVRDDENYLIFADRTGVGDRLAHLLGKRAIVVYRGQEFDLSHITVPVHHIIHLWSLEASSDSLTLAQLQESQALGVESVLRLVQDVLRSEHQPKFWLVTEQAISINDSPINPAQTPLWGLGKVLAVEHPQLWGGLMDWSGATAELLLAEIVNASGEDHIALRGEQRYVGRLVRCAPLLAQKQTILTPDGSYLITGGLGALGLQVARSLVRQGAKRLVLVSRRPPSSQTERAIAQLNAQVTIAQADVADEAEMTRLVRSIPDLRGVVHAAGTTHFQRLNDLTQAELAAVMRPKVLGGWVLHQLTQSLDLDFFVNFSSITSVFGSKGQAHYAAANHFLDGLAYHRRSLGLPALSVNWSFWDGAGMAAEELQTEAMRQLGLSALPPKTAIAAFNALLGSDQTQVTVADIDWTTFKNVFELQGRRSLLNEVGYLSKDGAEIEKSQLLQQIEAAETGDRYPLLLNALLTEIKTVLKLNVLPDSQRGLFELGMDSLMAVVLVNSIRSQLQTDLPIADLMQAPTIEAIARILMRSFDQGANTDVDTTAKQVDLWNEAVLDEKIIPEGVVSQAIQQIFLTGATGYLGAFLLSELLQQTTADIYCLVRAQDEATAMQRIQTNAAAYKLWDEAYRDRIRPLCGDLSQPRLGLTETQFNHLAQEIDVVYHNGAVLNFIYPYSALKASNVLGTQEILRLACQTKTKPLHYVSTDGVFDSSGWYDQEVVEMTPIQHTAGIELGYTQTKWVAEQLVTAARDRGLPVSIYRPPLIAGDSRTGVWFTDDFICRFIKGCIQLGTMPTMSNRLTMSPVDYVSRAIVHLSLQPQSLGQAFHLNNPDPAPWKEFVGSINQLGYPVATVSFEEWMMQLVDSVERSPDNALSELVPFFLRRWSDENLTFAELGQRRVRLNCQSTAQQLIDSGIDCARTDAKLLSKYFAYFVESGFLSPSKILVS
jgi:thioester reductase-like protein